MTKSHIWDIHKSAISAYFINDVIINQKKQIVISPLAECVMYCPDWIFDIICSQVAANFIKNDISIPMGAGRFVSGLADDYDDFNGGEIEVGAEEMIRLLDELEAGEAALVLLEGFGYFRLNYSFQGVKRNLKPLFGSVASGTKAKEYSARASLKRFKAYIFAFRSQNAMLAPAGWSLATQTDLKKLSEIAGQSTNPLDYL